MIFKQWKEIADNLKTQTRRVYKTDESFLHDNDHVITAVKSASDRIKWRVGQDYAVQAHRTGKGLFRIEITEIRLNRVQSISHKDIIAEGISKDAGGAIIRRMIFEKLWDMINDHAGSRWDDNPLVWIITFKSLLQSP